jgi:hypothetical protein
MPDLTDSSFEDVFTKHSSEIDAHSRAWLVIHKTFLDRPTGQFFLALPEPARFEDMKSVPLKFAIEQRGNPLLASENDQRARAVYMND